MNSQKLLVVAGTRPNFMKVAPLLRALDSSSFLDARLIHTGQHYDSNMSGVFFSELGIRSPDRNLGIHGGTVITQYAEIVKGFEQVITEETPSAVVVVGDVTSTSACATVAAHSSIPLVHVEAGLRSFDRSMPEEVNRIITDGLSELFFCTEESGRTNLLREGHDEGSIHLVGNLMIDTLLNHMETARESRILAQLQLQHQEYALTTLHRPSNVEDQPRFEAMLNALLQISQSLPVVFPLHPRTRNALSEISIFRDLQRCETVRLIDPLGYIDFLNLMMNSKLVLTDSGGIQEETTFLRIPCLTLRNNTERPITCDVGTNQLVSTTPHAVVSAFEKAIAEPVKGSVPPYWDGKSADRIVRILEDHFA